MASVSITNTDVEFGPCQVTFGGVDLGSFKGGVRFHYGYGVIKSKPDQLSAPNNAWMTNEEATITVPILETDLTSLQYIMPTGTYTLDGSKKKITVGGTQIASGDFQELIITPITDGAATISTDANDVITVHKVLCMGPVDKTYNMEGERVVTVEFHAFADTSESAGNQLFTLGDTTAT